MSKELLPKPETNLPLPEKELESGEDNQTTVVNQIPPKESRHLIRAFLFGFLFVVILATLGGAYFLGINKSTNNNQQTVKTVITSPTPTAGIEIGKFENGTYEDNASYSTFDGKKYIYRLTDDWDNWDTSVEGTLPFSINFPAQWSYVGGVFQDGNNHLRTELLPFIFPKGRYCFDKASDTTSSLISQSTIVIDGQKWVRRISKINNINEGKDSNKELYDFSYCLQNLDKGILISFTQEGSGNNNSAVINQILSTFKFTDASPTPTCRPRPSCLDSIPACKIAETSDMCPPTPKPSGNLAGPGEHCGGNISTAKSCSAGYHCQLNKIADLGGTCVKD